jgi:hypothetical protein
MMMLMRRKKGFFPGGIVEAPRGPVKIFKEIIKIIKIIIF